MYTGIRHYTFKGSIDKKSLDDYIGRIERTFLPGVQGHPWLSLVLSGKAAGE